MNLIKIILLYPYLALSFKFPIRSVITGRAIYNTIITKVSEELCDGQNLCISAMNMNPADPMQFVYFSAVLIAMNQLYNKYSTSDTETKLEAFNEYTKGRRFARNFIFIIVLLFAKNVNNAF